MGDNVCECPHPPGGKVVCSSMQIAICRVMDGEVRSFCIDPPKKFNELTLSGAEGFEDFLYDTLYAVTQEERWLQREPSVREALKGVQDAYDAGQDALEKGDWKAYGKAQDDLKDAIKEAQDAGLTKLALVGMSCQSSALPIMWSRKVGKAGWSSRW